MVMVVVFRFAKSRCTWQLTERRTNRAQPQREKKQWHSHHQMNVVMHIAWSSANKNKWMKTFWSERFFNDYDTSLCSSSAWNTASPLTKWSWMWELAQIFILLILFTVELGCCSHQKSGINSPKTKFALLKQWKPVAALSWHSATGHSFTHCRMCGAQFQKNEMPHAFSAQMQCRARFTICQLCLFNHVQCFWHWKECFVSNKPVSQASPKCESTSTVSNCVALGLWQWQQLWSSCHLSLCLKPKKHFQIYADEFLWRHATKTHQDQNDCEKQWNPSQNHLTLSWRPGYCSYVTTWQGSRSLKRHFPSLL